MAMSDRWKLYLLPLLGFTVALSMHLWHLGQPATIISDEVYFVHDSQNYLTGHAYLEAHPPLGMLQMATVFKFFGDRPFTWRVINAVEGALLVPLVWWLAWRLTKNGAAAAVALSLVLLDGFILTESRLGLINVPYILYGFAALSCVLKALDARRPMKWLVMAGVLMGAALSVKWLAALMAWPTIALWFWPKFFGQQRQAPSIRKFWLVSAAALILLPVLVYLLVWRVHFSWLGIPDDTLFTNVKMWYFHTHVTTFDIYHEPWWGWPILWQPFLHLNETVGDKTSAIWSIGNPWVWWTGTIIFVYSLIRNWKRHPYRLLMTFMLIAWLPFALVTREIFLYTAIPFGIFMFLLLAVWAGEHWTKYRPWIISYVIVALAVFVWFAPWYLNIPLSAQQQHLRQWLPDWQVKTSL